MIPDRPDDKQRRRAERAARQVANQAERAALRAARQADRLQRAAGCARQGRVTARVDRAGAAGQSGVTPCRDAVSPQSDASARTAGGAVQDFDVLIVGQAGPLERQAVILATSLRRNAPDFPGRLVVAEPLPQDAWAGSETLMGRPARKALTALGAEIRPFTARHFGRSYPFGNKIEALGTLDPRRPFLFLDSDTLVTGDLARVPFDFSRPTASMRREGTWPQPPAYGPGYEGIWRSLYDRFGLAIEGSLDHAQPDEHWERYLYFNAGWFVGTDAREFGRRFTEWAVAVRDDPGDALACQSLDPWLDQIVLPLVIHSLGGGRPPDRLAGMDGCVTTHWRCLPLLYAVGSEEALAEMEAILHMPDLAEVFAGWTARTQLVEQGLGRARIRPMFAAGLHLREKGIRQRIRAQGLWIE